MYEHSPWVAERAYAHVPQPLSQNGVTSCMADVVEAASRDEQLTLLRAHPDLAGRAARAGELTRASRAEQTSSGLDSLSAEERANLAKLNSAYTEKFGFPFIMAVKGATRQQILDGFEVRLPNTVEAEFSIAIQQVHRIAGFRIAEWFQEAS